MGPEDKRLHGTGTGMNSDLDGTVTVEVTLRGRRATIEDVQQALATLLSEGIPPTFEVGVYQREERVYERDVATRDQELEHTLTIRAERAAKP